MMNKHDDDLRKLRDDFVRFKREVTDALENLDESNFSGNMKKIVARLGGASAGFEAYADAEKAVARMFAEYKTEISSSITEIKAQATADRATIETIAKWQTDNDENVSSIASIKQQANNNGSDIVILSSRIDNTQSSLASVQTKADASGAFINMFAASSPYSIDVSKGYTYDSDNNVYIFQNENGENITVDSTNFAGIYISAMNNNFDSTVKLMANIIRFGNYASVDSLGNFYATRIFGRGVSDVGEYPGAYFADITSTMAGSATGEPVGGDFCIRKVPGYSDGIIRDDEDLVYGLMFDKTLGEDAYSVNFVVGSSLNYGGHSVWGYNYGQGKFYPKGTWDFSVCSVDGLGLVPVFG
jgi:hypothetical protein